MFGGDLSNANEIAPKQVFSRNPLTLSRQIY